MKTALLFVAMIVTVSVLAGLVPPRPPHGPGVVPPIFRLPQPDFYTTSGNDDDWEEEYYVSLYWDSGYGGQLIQFRVWLHSETLEYRLDGDILGSLGAKFWDNEISSIGPKKNNYPSRWNLYDKDGCDDKLESGRGARDQVEYNDQASSFRAWTPLGTEKGYCRFTICEDSEQDGDCLPFKLYRTGATDGTALVINFVSNHWNDEISSIDTWAQSDRSYRWKFYEHSGLEGEELILENGSTDDDLSDNAHSFNDMISSLTLIIDD